MKARKLGNTATGRALGWMVALTAVLGTGAGFGGCGDARPPIVNVLSNVVEKSAFTGSWYMTEQVIDFDYEASALGFVGEISTDGTSGGYAMVRIRWVIDEQNLYAFRDYQTVGDAEDPFAEAEEGFLGQPVAAYRIASHFDIRRQYNPTTGEEINVIVENSTDNRWWERRFMRVDWSRNLLSGWYGTSAEMSELFGSVRREATDIFVQSASNFPAEWRPQFLLMSCNGPDDTSESCRENDRLWARDYDADTLYSFNFVTQQLWSPVGPYCGDSALYGVPECASVLASIRTSFLRVSDRREYVPENFDDTMFERAGYFRMERDTFDGSSSAGDPSWGSTDFRNLAIFRHNIWTDWVDDAGNPVPYANRSVRRVNWHTSRELPTHLIRPAFEVASEWNSVLMGTVRMRRGDQPMPIYPRTQCQVDNPAGYCFCESGPGPDGTVGTPDDTVLQPDTDGDGNGDCEGRYDPFETPEEAAGRGVVNPYQCWVNDDGLEPDLNDPGLSSSDFDGWVNAEMLGTECVVTLTINGCNDVAVAANGGTVEGLECQERGDIRFNLLSYVDQPGTPFLGVAQFRADPVTGELLGTDANIGGPALEGYRTRALQAFDLISGRITESEFYTGEDIRAYLEYAGRVELPAEPRIDFSVELEAGLPGDPAISDELRNRMESIMERAEMLQGPEGRARIFDRREMLAGTDIERRLLENTESRLLAGMHEPMDRLGEHMMEDEELLDLASPFRGNFEEMIHETSELQARMSALGLHMPTNFTDDSVLWYVNRVQRVGWTRARVEFDLNRRLYRQTEIHEMGHCMGLRHDFSGSTDTGNYAPDYYLIADQIPLPDPRDFDVDGDVGLSYEEANAYEAEYSDARRNRELAGIDASMTSSIMDYTANWYERIQGSGRHDWMAVALGYTNMVDVYDRGEAPTGALEDVNPATTGRVYATYYMGGEVCSTDADCPYSATGALSADLTAANRDGGLTQSCVTNPTTPSRSVCSNYDADAAAILDAATTGTRYLPINYRYCEDYRAGTRSLPYCNTFDEGDSFREMVRNGMEAYERSYIFSAFRRYRRTFGVGGYIDGLLRYLFPMINIEQNLMYRYQFDPAFRDEHGPFGFEDEFLATADVLNFMARIMAQPGIGSYAYDRDWDWFERINQDPDAPGANLRVRIGQGRFFQSIYQAGLTGISRIERIGSFIDKIITMQLLTIRGLSPFYGPDAMFYTNFYDLFPVEMNQLFTGMIADEADAYMPRVRCGSGTFPACADPELVYMDFYRGDCLTPGSTTCRPNPAEVTYNRPELTTVNGGDSFLLQSYATIYGLTEFPVYYDTTFESQMFLCIEGTGDCTAPADSAIEGVDYVRHTSPRFGLSYLAWQLDPSGRNEASIAFAMVTDARNSDFIARTLRDLRGDFGGPPNSLANLTAAQQAALLAIPYVIPTTTTGSIDGDRVDTEITRTQQRAEQLESFFNYVVELQRRFGITMPAIWRRQEL